MERHLRNLLSKASETDSVAEMLESAINETLTDTELQGDDRKQLIEEFDRFREVIHGFKFALSRPYFTNLEKKQAGSGGLAVHHGQSNDL